MVFDRWAAQNRIPKRMLTPVDKLSFIGKRGMGAFEFVPATPGLESSSALQIDSLYQLSRRILKNGKRCRCKKTRRCICKVSMR